MNRSDIARYGLEVSGIAALLEAHGAHAWDRTREWQAGPGAANLEPHRSNGTVADPTGQAAISHQPDPWAELITRVEALVRAARDVKDSLDRVGPKPTETRWCAWMLEVGVRERAEYTVDGKPASRWVYKRNLQGKATTVDHTRERAARVGQTGQCR